VEDSSHRHRYIGKLEYSEEGGIAFSIISIIHKLSMDKTISHSNSIDSLDFPAVHEPCLLKLWNS